MYMIFAGSFVALRNLSANQFNPSSSFHEPSPPILLDDSSEIELQGSRRSIQMP